MRLPPLTCAALFTLACACTSDPSPQDSDASESTGEPTSTSETSEDSQGTETGETGEGLSPLWSIEFPEQGVYPTIQDFEIAANGEILALVEGGGEFLTSGTLYKIDGEGQELWSAQLEASSRRVCARPNAGAFVLADLALPEEETTVPVLMAFDPEGALTWTADVAVPTPPQFNEFAIACAHDEDAVFVVGNSGEQSLALVRYDDSGAPGEWIEGLLPTAHANPSLTMTESGQLLLGATENGSGDPTLSLLETDGSVVAHIPLDGADTRRPHVAARDGVWASAARGDSLDNETMRVDVLDPTLDSLTTQLDEDAGAEATWIPRPLAIDDQGRVLVTFPRWDQQLRIAIHTGEGIEALVLDELVGRPTALGVDPQGRVVVGGTIIVETGIGFETPTAWLAAYEL